MSKAAPPSPPPMSRREREFMDIVYRLGQASVVEVRGQMVQPPSYSAVRAGLRLLEEKGHLLHEEIDGSYIYRPTVPRERARLPQLTRLLRTFFSNSAEEMVATLLDSKETKLTPLELDRLASLIERARRERRK